MTSPPASPGMSGPQPLACLLPRLTRPAFKRKTPATTILRAEWPALVGPELAAETEPLRLGHGTLTLACSGTVAVALQHLAPQLTERINTALGRKVVERLRFLHRPAHRQGGFLARATPLPPPSPLPLPASVAEQLTHVASLPLREALARLAAAVYRPTATRANRAASTDATARANAAKMRVGKEGEEP